MIATRRAISGSIAAGTISSLHALSGCFTIEGAPNPKVAKTTMSIKIRASQVIIADSGKIGVRETQEVGSSTISLSTEMADSKE
jgi:hypothetical protein